ncbi:hypothetical protein MmTuc01_0900 [Methanosarcina mazei Tuc01]|uniref:Uncharacterized protein n=1 Tax=Methanosarcina mazei Tuc01 TaxID=1236903 RepID=M1P7A3_METMZ|nr:hypothetical protein MmTuc01_0900 [Methanosarcina mazei Tuc01]
MIKTVIIGLFLKKLLLNYNDCEKITLIFLFIVILVEEGLICG